ncbi:MAG: hypothetical protein ACM3ZF_05815 [Mycobacterium leprae]
MTRNNINPVPDPDDEAPAIVDHGDEEWNPGDDAVDADEEDGVEVGDVLRDIPVRRPKPRTFFRGNPKDEGGPWSIDIYTYIHENPGSDRVVYWVTKKMRSHFDQEDLRLTRLVLCMDRAKTVFLWPINMPLATSNAQARAASRSSLACAQDAQERWVRMRWNPNIPAYVTTVAQGYLGDPRWPTESCEEILRLAFLDQRITSPDHAVLRELRGE